MRAADTSVEAHDRWVEGLRAMTPRQKLERVRELNRSAMTMAMAGVRLRHPDACPDEQQVHLART